MGFRAFMVEYKAYKGFRVHRVLGCRVLGLGARGPECRVQGRGV